MPTVIDGSGSAIFNTPLPTSQGGTGNTTGAYSIIPISASVSANAMTISSTVAALDFRSTTLGSGTITNVSGAPANLVIPSTATLGTVNAVQSRLIVLAINNVGTIELAVVNIAGGVNLDETGLISTTAIAAASNSATTIYSNTARTNVAYRVIGAIDSTQATAGTWATAPSLIQGAGGNALDSFGSLGYSQTWQNVTGSRALGTTYYNTTGRPISISWWGDSSTGGNNYTTMTINGTVVGSNTGVASAGWRGGLQFIVPSGASYSLTGNGGIAGWFELR